MEKVFGNLTFGQLEVLKACTRESDGLIYSSDSVHTGKTYRKIEHYTHKLIKLGVLQKSPKHTSESGYCQFFMLTNKGKLFLKKLKK